MLSYYKYNRINFVMIIIFFLILIFEYNFWLLDFVWRVMDGREGRMLGKDGGKSGEGDGEDKLKYIHIYMLYTF